MGGVTPVWGIRYPYQEEVANPTHFQNFADDVDAAIDLLDAAALAASTRAILILHKPADGVPTQATGVNTAISWSDVRKEAPDSLWSIGTPTIITLPARGLYRIGMVTGQHSPVTTVLSQMLTVSVNGVIYLRRRVYRDGRSVTDTLGLSGVFPCLTAGHQLVLSYQWNGTGGPAATPDAIMWLEQLAIVP
jgi:hypothetical protein